MKSFCMFFSLLIMCHFTRTLCAQHAHIDSLLNILTHAKADTNTVTIYRDLSDKYLSIPDYNRSFQYADSALTLSFKLNYKKGIGFSTAKKGSIYYKMADYQNSLKYYQAALPYLGEVRDSVSLSGCVKSIGILYRRLGNYPEAMRYQLDALRIHERMGDKSLIADSYLSIAVLYSVQHKYQEALNSNKAALEIFKELGTKESMSKIYNNIGIIYTETDEYSEALTNFSKALKLNYDLGDKEAVASNYNMISRVYGSQGNYKEALKNVLIAIRMLDELAVEDRIKSSAYINAGAALIRLAEADTNKEESHMKYEDAYQYFNSALTWSKESGDKEKIANAYGGLYDLYYRQGNYQKALEYYKLLSAYEDSLLNEQSIKQTEQLKIQYETEKKDKELELKEAKLNQQQALLFASKLEAKNRQNEIVLLNANNEVRELQLTEAERKLAQQQAEAKAQAAELEVVKKDKVLKEQSLARQELVRNGLIVCTLLLIVAGMFVFRTIQLRRKLEKQQAVLQERKRISADLHDDVGSTLSSIRIMSTVAENDPLQATEMVKKISENSKRMLDNMGDIVWTENPDRDSFSEMFARMNQYASQTLEPKGILFKIVSSDANSSIELAAEQRRNFYLIFKEAVNNLAKYSGCTEASITISGNAKNLAMKIADNGKGFEVNNGSTGNGLKNMRKRAETLRANLQISSHAGAGTTVELNMPVT